MANKTLIIGKGFFGTRIHEAIGGEITETRITSLADALAVCDQYKPQTIINAVGFIGRNVDDCELHKDTALTSNTIVPLLIAEACVRNRIKMIHISSGCIYHYDYEKDAPIAEDLPPDFFDLYYSRTKIYAEAQLAVLAKKIPLLILRPRVPLDDRPSPKNLLTKLITFKKVITLPNSVTYMPDFIRAFTHLMAINAVGIYHLVNKDPLYYPALMDTYKKMVPAFAYEKIDFKILNMVRTNLALSTAKLEASGFAVRTINEILKECVKNYLQSS